MNSIIYTGEINPVVLRADGKTEDYGWSPNLLTAVGMDYLAVFQSTAPFSVMNHMQVGTGTTAAAVGDVALVGAIGSRSTMLSRTVPQSANVLVEVATFAGFVSGITSAVIREAGVFNHAVTGGTMRSRAVMAAITLADSDYLQLSWRSTVSSHG